MRLKALTCACSLDMQRNAHVLTALPACSRWDAASGSAVLKRSVKVRMDVLRLTLLPN